MESCEGAGEDLVAVAMSGDTQIDFMQVSLKDSKREGINGGEYSIVNEKTSSQPNSPGSPSLDGQNMKTSIGELPSNKDALST